jgi:dTDP-4-dehydrorhamnose reductase
MQEKDKIVLVTGASSYVGAGIYIYLKQFFNIIGTYNSNKLFPELIKMDITNKEEVFGVIGKTKPDYIIHVAANPNAKWCEANPKEAITLNENVVEAANANSAKLIYISSFAAINPTNLYGKTKLDGETITKETKSGWVILRPSLIIGYSPNTINDRPFNRFLKNISENKPASYDISWKFQPTELAHLSEVTKACIDKKINEEIIPVAVPELKSRFDLAKDILTPFKKSVSVIDAKDSSPIFEQSLAKLKELNLPTYTYNEIISKIVKETKEKLE